MPLRLILNADDFGLTSGINRAILELFHARALTSATLMANGPAFAEAADLACANPGLGVGCHLVFVDGIPISHPQDIPTLLGGDGKTFRPTLLEFAQAALRGSIRPADLARETQAQIQKLQRAGVDVTHVDTHKHTHAFPHVTQTVLQVAERCGVPAMRNPFEPRWLASLDLGVPWLRRAQVAALGRNEPQFRSVAAEPIGRGLLPDGTLGISATGTLTTLRLHDLLAALRPRLDQDLVYELCCHPGHVDTDLRAQRTRLVESRAVEFRALRTVIPQILEHPLHPELIHYGNLGIPGQQRAVGHHTRSTGFEKVL